MTTHYVRYYDCGLHVERQCRCMGERTKTVGQTPCPDCHPSKPTARELCDLLRGECDHSRRSCESIGCCGALAARVEKVLALRTEPALGSIADQSWALGYRAALKGVRRILNGEQP